MSFRELELIQRSNEQKQNRENTFFSPRNPPDAGPVSCLWLNFVSKPYLLDGDARESFIISPLGFRPEEWMKRESFSPHSFFGRVGE